MGSARVVITLGIALFTLLNGCKDADTGTGGGAGPVTIQLNWKPEPQFGGFYAAEQSGAFKQRGLDVKIVAGGVGTPTVQMVGAGSVPFAVVSADELIVARSKGSDVVALFAVYQTCPQGIMTHASRGFKAIGDVFANPGTVAMQRGLPYAEYLERKFGFGKVKVVPSPGGSIAQFLNDKNFSQQCFITSEPIAATEAGSDPQTFLVADAGYNPYTTVLVTRKSYLDQNGETVKKVVDAVREGWSAYLRDPAQTNQHMHGLNPTMDLKTFAASAAAQLPLIQTDDTKTRGLGAMTPDRWRTLGQQLADLGVIEKAPTGEECFVAY